MSLWETIDELLDDSSSVLNSNNVEVSNENKKPSSNDIFDEDELDQNELLGLIDEDDDLGLLNQEDETVEEVKIENNKKDKEEYTHVPAEEPKTKKENEVKVEAQESIENSQNKEKISKSISSENIQNNEEVKKNNRQEHKINTERVKSNQYKQVPMQRKPRYDMKNQNFNRNNGILPIPSNFNNAPNFPLNNLNQPNISQQNSIMFSTPMPQIMPNFNQQYNPIVNQTMPPFQQNPMNQINFFNQQQQHYSNYQSHEPINPVKQMQPMQFNQIQPNPNFMPLQKTPMIQGQITQPPSHFNHQSQFYPMGFNQQPVPSMQFHQPNLVPQAPKPANVYLNPSFFPKQQQKKEDGEIVEPKNEAKSAVPKRSRKDLDLLLEKRLAAELEKEKNDEKLNKKKEASKRKSSETKKSTSNSSPRPPNKVTKVQEPNDVPEKTKSEPLALVADQEYLKKLEEQKQKRQEILRLKEEKRNQRFKMTTSEKNENTPVKSEPKRTVIQSRESLSLSDNRIIKTSESNSNNSQAKRLIVKNLSLSTNEKKLLNMCNSINIKEKVKENDSLFVSA